MNAPNQPPTAPRGPGFFAAPIGFQGRGREASRLGRCCSSSLGGRWRARSSLGWRCQQYRFGIVAAYRVRVQGWTPEAAVPYRQHRHGFTGLIVGRAAVV